VVVVAVAVAVAVAPLLCKRHPPPPAPSPSHNANGTASLTRSDGTLPVCLASLSTARRHAPNRCLSLPLSAKVMTPPPPRKRWSVPAHTVLRLESRHAPHTMRPRCWVACHTNECARHRLAAQNRQCEGDRRHPSQALPSSDGPHVVPPAAMTLSL
jgi:hypothetical protein